MTRKELIEYRTPNTKHFLNKDGSIIVDLYKEPIHYLENGVYQDIDNTLVQTKEGIKNKRNDFQVVFTEEKDNAFINISCKDKKLSMFPKNRKLRISPFSKSVKRSVITYEEMNDEVSLEYKVLSNQLKESIILNKKPETNQYVFIINTTLDLVLNEDNTIYMMSKENIYYKIEKPYMVDANQVYSESVNYDLTKIENGYEITITVDKEWLEDKERVYPVIIDPTITSVQSSTSVIDTYIYEGDSEDTTYNKSVLYVGTDKSNKIYRTLLKFTLPKIPAGFKVVEANVSLSCCPDEFGLAYQDVNPLISVHKLTQDWTESGAKWSNMHDKYSPHIEDYFWGSRMDKNNINPNFDYKNSFQLTDLVQRWYNGEPNYGIMLKEYKEVVQEKSRPAFYIAKDYNDTSYAKPFLSIVYKSFNGLESYLSYTSQKHDFGSSYVNNYTGNLTTTFHVANTVGGSLPVNLYLVYNTTDVELNTDYGFGLGIKPNLIQTLVKETIEDQEVLKFTDEDGTIHYFYKKFLEYKDDTILYSEDYYDEDGLGLKISFLDNHYIMTDKNANTSIFNKHTNEENPIYYLEEIKDTNNKKMQIIYDNQKLSRVIDANNNELHITYENNKITFTSPHLSTVVSLTNNLLTSISSLCITETISYNQNKLIERITNANGLATQYDYISQISYRVKKVAEISKLGKVGKYLTFSYHLYDTKVTDRKGHSNTYIFNSFGNVVGMTNLDEEENLNDAYGKSYAFGNKEEGTANKLLTDKSLVKYVDNLIANSSFETEDDWHYDVSDLYTTNVLSTEVAHSGKRSLFVEMSRGGGSIYRDFKVEKGKTYTFSAYIKGIENPDPKNMNLNLILSYSDKEEIKEIKGLSTDFVRYSVTIDYKENASEDLRIKIRSDSEGYVGFYLDDLQLEEGEVANYYNLVENSSFKNGIEGFSIPSKEEGESAEVVDLPNHVKALKIHSEPDGGISLEKVFQIKGKKGDTFNLSFWYKNEGLIPTGGGMGSGVWATIFFGYTDGKEFGACVPMEYLNVGSTNWQFFSENFQAEWDYDYLEIRINNFGAANDCYITNFTLFKDLESYSYTYDENGNLVSVTDLNKEQSTMTYDKNNQLLTTFNPMGDNYVFEYDNLVTDRMRSAISKTGITNTITYDENGNPIMTKIQNRKPLDSILEDKKYYIRAKGTNKYFYVNVDKSLSVKESECSYDTFYLMKETDDQIKIKHAILNNYYLKENNGKIELAYGDNNNVFHLVTNTDSSYSILKVNENSKKAITIQDNFSLSLIDFEETSKQEFFFEQVDYKLFISSSSTYTEDGRFIKSVKDTLDNEMSYDINTTNGLVNKIIDPNNVETNYIYDDKLRVKEINKKEHKVEYAYDNNQLSKIKHGTKNYIFTYDEFNNPSTVKINEATLVSNTYEPNNGNLSKITYGNNQEVNYTYDTHDRVKSIIKENDVYTHYYDNLGRITRLTSINHTYDYAYDFAKRLSSFKDNQYETIYDYDKGNKVIQKEEKLGNKKYTYHYQYNTESALTELIHGTNQFHYLYDELGRLKESNINGTYKTTYSYVTKGNKTSTRIEEVDDNGTKYHYTYDKLGNITEVYQDNLLIHTYTYDDFSQLIKEDNLIDKETIEYHYDNYGNILDRKVYSDDTNTLLKEDTYTYGDTNWQDLLTQYKEESITYDIIGNPLTIGNKTLTWMNGRELATYSDGENSVSYRYNLNGIRTNKVVNGIETKYYLEGTSILFEDRNGDVLYYIYSGDELLGFIYKDVTYYYHKNIFGDVIGILDLNYNEIVTYTYDSFGVIKNIVDNSNLNLGVINPFRYRSYYYDEETKLYYLNSRYYNPLWGRFVNADELVGFSGVIVGYNLFIYSLNNPVNNTDISGKLFAKAWNWVKKNTKEAAKNIKKSAKEIGSSISKVADKVSEWGKGTWKTAKKYFNGNKKFVVDGKVGLGTEVNLGVAGKSIGSIGFDKSFGCDNINGHYTTTNGSVTFFDVGFAGEVRNYDGGYGNPMAMPWEVWNDANTEKTWTSGWEKGFTSGEGIDVSANAETTDNTIFVGIEIGAYLFVGGGIKIGFNITPKE